MSTRTHADRRILSGVAPGPLPQGWQSFDHPNGDIYFYYAESRLITPVNVRDEDTLKHLKEAHAEYVQELQWDPAFSLLPDDLEVVISVVTASEAAIRMYSRSAGAAYTWSEETGMSGISCHLLRTKFQRQAWKQNRE